MVGCGRINIFFRNFADVSTLRPYQQDMLTRLEKAWKEHRSVMVQMPTGTGKTHLMAAVIKKGMKSAAAQILVVAHRRELLEQIRRTIVSFDIDLEKDGVMVESIQKLSRGEKLRKFTPSLVIIDEAHHALAKTYKILWEWWPEAKFLGLTATPCRLSGEPFTDLFDTLLQSYSIREFIRQGWLSDLDYVSVRSDSQAMQQIATLKKRGVDGDYQTKETALVLDRPESIAYLYECYEEYAKGKKGIVYAINREHAQHITEYYQAQGVKCAVIDSKTPAKERDRLVAEYKLQTPPLTPLLGRGAAACGLDVLVNVDIFGEGFDVPEVEFIQLARPTLSLALYLQQVGRGMRISEGKSEVMILDQVGSYLVFGLPTSDRNWPAMFRGKLAGKGKTPPLAEDCSIKTQSPLDGRRAAAQELNGRSLTDEKEKRLVNEQMLRLKLKETVKQQVQEAQQTEPPVRKRKWKAVLRDVMWYNDDIALYNTALVLRSDTSRVYWIVGYYGDSVIVKTDRVIGVQQVMKDGTMGKLLDYAPKGMTPTPDVKLLGLRKSERVKEEWRTKYKFTDIYLEEMYLRLQICWQWHRKVAVRMSSHDDLLILMKEEVRNELLRDDFEGENSKVLIIANDYESLMGISEVLNSGGFNHAVSNDVWQDELVMQHKIVVAKIRGMINQQKQIGDTFQPTLVIVDAAASRDKRYERLLNRWPGTRLLGLTTDGVMKGGPEGVNLFEVLLQSWDNTDPYLSDHIKELEKARQEAGVAGQGVELFVAGKMLGMKYNGTVTCKAEFTRIDLLYPSDYYALAKKQLFLERTVIDKQGRDTNAQLTGSVLEHKKGIFSFGKHYIQRSGMALAYTFEVSYWDVPYHRQYKFAPEIETIGGVDFNKVPHGYVFRLQIPGYEDQVIKRNSIYCNDHITIARDVLFLNSNPMKYYRVYGYCGNEIVVMTQQQKRYIYNKVGLDGSISEPYTRLDPETVKQPMVGELFLG